MARKKTTGVHQTQKHRENLLLPPALDSEVSTKLEMLKSLNQRLLKEEYARRQQVDSILRSNDSLETELNRSKLRSLEFETELVELSEMAVQLEVEKSVLDVFIDAYLELTDEFMEQGRISESREQELKCLNDEKESEIRRLNDRLNEIERNLRNEKQFSERLSVENGEIKENLVSKTSEIKVLSSNLFEAQERNKNFMVEMKKLQLSHDSVTGLMKEKEMQIESLSRDRDSLDKSLGESMKFIEELKVNAAEEIQRFEEIKREEMHKRQNLEKIVSELNDIVVSLEKDKAVLSRNVVEMERKCTEHETIVEKIKEEMDQLTQEKKLGEDRAEQLGADKIAMEIKLGKTVEQLAEEKQKLEKLVHEKTILVADNDRQVTEVAELKAIVAKMEKTVEVNAETIESLESKVSDYRFKLEHVETEKNGLENSLHGTKQNVMELEAKCGELVNEIVEAKAVRDAEKEMVELERGTLKREISRLENRVMVSQNVNSEVMKMLKETTCSWWKEEGNEVDDEELKPFVREIETIKKSLRDEMAEMNKKIKKKNRVWSVVSSATTVLAACSLAYAARGH